MLSARHGQHDRIDHGVADLLPQAVARLRVVGEPFEHCVELTGMLAGRDRRAIDGRKRAGEVLEPHGEGMAFEYLRPHAEHDALQPGFLRVLAHGKQRLLEWQAGAH